MTQKRECIENPYIGYNSNFYTLICWKILTVQVVTFLNESLHMRGSVMASIFFKTNINYNVIVSVIIHEKPLMLCSCLPDTLYQM